MKQDDFELYRNLLSKRSGLVLTPDKGYLLESRLNPVARKWGRPSLEALAQALRATQDPKLVKDVVEAMTTHETSFFRDGKPFELFKAVVLPCMVKNRTARRAFRIWCAASSSGQEPYTLAMLLREHAVALGCAGWAVDIVATDISSAVLEQAKRGCYSQFEVQRGLPVQLLVKYFEQKPEGWVLKEDIRKMVRFQQFNLLDPMEGLGVFDIVFCRNVLIYFDEKNKGDILRRISGRMAPDGFLFLGGAETVLGISDVFRPAEQHRGLYVLQKGSYNMGTPSTATA